MADNWDKEVKERFGDMRAVLSVKQVAALFLVFGIILGAVGYYTLSSIIYGAHSQTYRPNSSTQYTTLRSTFSENTSTTCSASTPMYLASVTAALANQENPMRLIMVWGNCSGQTLSFNVAVAPSYSSIQVEISTYGKNSTVLAYLENCPSYSCTRVEADGNVTLALPIITVSILSPNAIFERVSGNLTAIDPISGLAISSTKHFDIPYTQGGSQANI